MEASLIALLGCVLGGMPDAAFLDPHDPVWEAPPLEWKTGMPLGNGHIGALIWGDGHPLKITLDKYDAWETREKPLDFTYADLRKMIAEGRKEEAEQCMRTERIYGDGPYPTRLPMPRLEIDFGPKEAAAPFQARLNLATASARIDAQFAGDRKRIVRATVPMDDNVLLLDISDPMLDGLNVKVGFDHLSPSARETLKRWGYPEPEITPDEFGGLLRQRTPSGYEYAVAWREVPMAPSTRSVHSRLLVVALVSSNEAADPAAAAREKVERWTPKQLGSTDGEAWDLSAHKAWWASYWKRSFLTIPDARLESLYHIETYKLACSSVPGGYPATLQGVWTLDGGMPPWSGDYHLDMNVQQSYWPIYAANRLDLGEPLYRAFSACLPRWREQCKQFFGFDGAWSGCAIGPKGERIYGYSGVELWPGNAAWLAHHYWLHYRYSMDKAFLRDEAMPMMRACFLTYANLLEKGEDGRLHVPVSYSPEYYGGGFKAYAPDPNCDLALIRFLGQAILDTNEVLGTEDEATPRVREVLANLVDFVQKDNRLWVSAGQPLEHSHRHHSHLMMIHPLGLLSTEGSESEKALIEGSLHQIRVLGPGQWTGWAYPWMSLIVGRAGYGNWAWQMLDTYANSFITPNTFHINGDPRIFGYSLFDYDPMTLEAGFGAAAAIQEMLLQSQGGVIRVFPSMPDRWHDAAFEHLRAEGAFLVSAAMKEGKTSCLQITSEAGGRCRVRNPFAGAAYLTDAAPGEPPRQLEGALLEFDTAPGQSFLISDSAERPQVIDAAPLFERTPDEQHFYGVKRLARF